MCSLCHERMREPSSLTCGPLPRSPARAVSTSLGYNERNTKKTGPPLVYEKTVVGAVLGLTDYFIRERAPISWIRGEAFFRNSFACSICAG